MRILAIEYLREFRDAEIAEALEDARYECARRWAEWERTPSADALEAYREMLWYVGALEAEDTRRYVLMLKAKVISILKPSAKPNGKAGAMQI